MKYLFFLSLISMQTHAAEEILNLQGLSITGDKELPKVLYIVPWENHKATKVTAPNYKSTLSEDFDFIHRPNNNF